MELSFNYDNDVILDAVRASFWGARNSPCSHAVFENGKTMRWCGGNTYTTMCCGENNYVEGIKYIVIDGWSRCQNCSVEWEDDDESPKLAFDSSTYIHECKDCSYAHEMCAEYVKEMETLLA